MDRDLIESAAIVTNLSHEHQKQTLAMDEIFVREKEQRARITEVKSIGVNKIQQLQQREVELSNEREAVDIQESESALHLAAAMTTEATTDEEL
jgi:hypothetical protein